MGGRLHTMAIHEKQRGSAIKAGAYDGGPRERGGGGSTWEKDHGSLVLGFGLSCSSMRRHWVEVEGEGRARGREREICREGEAAREGAWLVGNCTTEEVVGSKAEVVGSTATATSCGGGLREKRDQGERRENGWRGRERMRERN